MPIVELLAGDTIVLTNWTTAPELDYETPAILLGSRGAMCAACGQSLEGRRLVAGVFCSDVCRAAEAR